MLTFIPAARATSTNTSTIQPTIIIPEGKRAILARVAASIGPRQAAAQRDASSLENAGARLQREL
jgi:hypothetical protein